MAIIEIRLQDDCQDSQYKQNQVLCQLSSQKFSLWFDISSIAQSMPLIEQNPPNFICQDQFYHDFVNLEYYQSAINFVRIMAQLDVQITVLIKLKILRLVFVQSIQYLIALLPIAKVIIIYLFFIYCNFTIVQGQFSDDLNELIYTFLNEVYYSYENIHRWSGIILGGDILKLIQRDQNIPCVYLHQSQQLIKNYSHQLDYQYHKYHFAQQFKYVSQLNSFYNFVRIKKLNKNTYRNLQKLFTQLTYDILCLPLLKFKFLNFKNRETIYLIKGEEYKINLDYIQKGKQLFIQISQQGTQIISSSIIRIIQFIKFLLRQQEKGNELILRIIKAQDNLEFLIHMIYDMLQINDECYCNEHGQVADQQFEVRIYQNRKLMNEFYFYSSKSYAKQTIIEYCVIKQNVYLLFEVTEDDSIIEFLEIQVYLLESIKQNICRVQILLLSQTNQFIFISQRMDFITLTLPQDYRIKNVLLRFSNLLNVNMSSNLKEYYVQEDSEQTISQNKKKCILQKSFRQ